jgi:hypothetical protein
VLVVPKLGEFIQSSVCCLQRHSEMDHSQLSLAVSVDEGSTAKKKQELYGQVFGRGSKRRMADL